MADLISREAALDLLHYYPIKNPEPTDIIPAVLETARKFIARLPAVDAVEVGSCEGCIYSHRKRPQKCSCCRRNRDLKDCYGRREENAAD